ncbi:type 1 glutamine amidotransferase [Ruegeria marina]|uniref:GMP synthase-Glutamine amidotransferase n=1 Tax=Ruegeria marina TaxID=639004 RepID=A0A1G6LLR1_9RHOB|nr:type 1 glutamine amidotransferase [Ruegeria marina]SDC44064.1 GMP synthase-Glutamine amidotransferase [Ruegeria marina]
MHLAILMTNTDESEFARAHPRDGEKFTALIRRARPAWTTSVFAVKDGQFPETLDGIDGAMITGSPASVLGTAPWIGRLLELIRDMHSRQIPIFGACFGHQAIALALGGRIGRNPGGWVQGLTRNRMLERPVWARDLPDEVRLYGSHVEQVTALPAGATAIMQGPDCPISGFAIGDRIYTTQHHPEMTHDFITALTEEMASDLGHTAHAQAMASLSDHSDMDAFAESIARFFEQARPA